MTVRKTPSIDTRLSVLEAQMAALLRHLAPATSDDTRSEIQDIQDLAKDVKAE